MISVWCVLWGTKYPAHYVYRLRNAVRRHLLQEHRFVVLTAKPMRLPTVAPPSDWEGWWQKLALFKVAEPGSRNLYIDLDSVIVGNLDRLLVPGTLAMARNWAQSGHDSCQSSVMVWTGGEHQDLYDDCKDADRGRLWGDQEWITERLGKPGEGKVTEIPHPLVSSYKYHCREQGKPPAGAAVCTFHGEPKMDCVEDPWVKANWW